MQIARAFAAAVALFPCAAAAQPAATEEACLADHRRTQELQLEKKLLEAETAAVACARAHCPEEVRTMCTDFVTRIRASQPTVVFEIRGASGTTYTTGTITIDGSATTHAPDGSAIAINPGSHDVEYETAGFPKARAKVLVSQGEKDKKVVLEVADAAAASFSPWAHVLGGLSLASLTAFGALGIVTTLQADALEEDCGNRCARQRPADVDAIGLQAIAADVCLAAGLTLFAAAALTMGLTWEPSPSAEARTSIHVGPSSAQLTLQF